MSRRMIPDSATVGLWRLDEATFPLPAVDVGPNALTGTNNGTTAVGVSNLPFAYARNFVRASSQYITVPSFAWSALTKITIEVWINFVDWSLTWNPIFTHSNGYAEFMVGNTGNVFFGFNTGGGGRSRSYTPTWSVGAWYYLAAAYDRQRSYIYLNGSLVDVYDFGSVDNLTLGTSTTYIGGRWDLSGYLNGQMAELRISDRERAPWEIFNTWKGFQARDPVAGFGVEA